MDLYEIRRRNVAWLCDRYGRSAVSERLGYLDNNYINGITAASSKTRVGNGTAKRIETELKGISTLPGWLDRPQWEDPQEIKQLQGRIVLLNTRQRRAVAALVDVFLVENAATQNPGEET